MESESKGIHVVYHHYRIRETAYTISKKSSPDRVEQLCQPYGERNGKRGFIPRNYGEEHWAGSFGVFEAEPAPRGGMTVCEIIYEDAVLAQGRAWCSLKDAFCYRIGRNIARGRAWKQLEDRQNEHLAGTAY